MCASLLHIFFCLHILILLQSFVKRGLWKINKLINDKFNHSSIIIYVYTYKPSNLLFKKVCKNPVFILKKYKNCLKSLICILLIYKIK